MFDMSSEADNTFEIEKILL